MNTSALVTLILVWGAVAFLTGYFFVKILRAKKKD